MKKKIVLLNSSKRKQSTFALLEEIATTDGIVIGTPVYLRHISGLLKTLVDRGCSWYHRSPIVGKPILLVTTTAASGTRQTLAYLRDLAVQMRMLSISRNEFHGEWNYTLHPQPILNL